MRREYKLKKCPFCGGEAYLERSHRAFINAKSTRGCFVRCTNCNARSGRKSVSEYGHTSYSIDAEEAVVEMWNRRV